MVIDKTTVSFEWKPEELKENIRFEVEVIYDKDSNSSNDSKATATFSMKESGGLYVLHTKTVHQIIAYKAFSLLPTNIQSGITTSYRGLPGAPTDNNANIGTTITEGAWEEDEPPRYCNHYWNTTSYATPHEPIDPDAGYTISDPVFCKFAPYESAYRRAQRFWDDNVLPYYTGKDKYGNANSQDVGLSFWWLGRVAHLLGDMSVPDMFIMTRIHWVSLGPDMKLL